MRAASHCGDRAGFGAAHREDDRVARLLWSHLPHADVDGWETNVQKEGVLAVEALRRLDDTSHSAKARWSTAPTRLTPEELAVVDEAIEPHRHCKRRHWVAAESRASRSVLETRAEAFSPTGLDMRLGHPAARNGKDACACRFTWWRNRRPWMMLSRSAISFGELPRPGWIDPKLGPTPDVTPGRDREDRQQQVRP